LEAVCKRLREDA
jgi:hypothetical protein